MKIKAFAFKFLLLVFVFFKSIDLAFSDPGHLSGAFLPFSEKSSLASSLLNEKSSHKAQPLEVLLKPVFKEQIMLTLYQKKKKKGYRLASLTSTQLTIKPQLLTPRRGHRDTRVIFFSKEPQHESGENGILMTSTKKK